MGGSPPSTANPSCREAVAAAPSGSGSASCPPSAVTAYARRAFSHCRWAWAWTSNFFIQPQAVGRICLFGETLSRMLFLERDQYKFQIRANPAHLHEFLDLREVGVMHELDAQTPFSAIGMSVSVPPITIRLPWIETGSAVGPTATRCALRVGWQRPRASSRPKGSDTGKPPGVAPGEVACPWRRR